MAVTSEQYEFIETIGAYARADMSKSKVIASLTIAQAILESNWGKSGLSQKANALFGIKASGSWKGKVYNASTNECYDGVNMTVVTALFRAYNNWPDSIADHSALLTGLPRYSSVVGEIDYKKACKAIQAAGYATDPVYADKLVNVIETYHLYMYDDTVETNKTGEINMNENELRRKVVDTAAGYLGCKVSNGTHKPIIDFYNSNPPLARGYKMSYSDAWCACFVSVVAMKSGVLGIIPKEVSCNEMINLFKKAGLWQELDSYTPKTGDIIFYDWQDTGVGNNVGTSEHVGIVLSITDAMVLVIEGNMNNAVGYRTIPVNGKFIRGFGLPDYASMTDNTQVVEKEPIIETNVCSVGTAKLKVDGGSVATVNSILKDGTNYVKLRDLANLLDYDVQYDGANNIVILNHVLR